MKRYNRIAIFVGHSILANGQCTSADGRDKGGKLEYAVCKELAYDIKKHLDKIGQPCDVIVVPEGKYNSGYEDNYKLPIANSGKYDLVIELHLNSYNGSAKGAEVLCYPATNSRAVAQRVQAKLATVFNDRGIIETTKFYMLRETKPCAIMIESFFCDSKSDCDKFDSLGSSGLARKIAEGLIDGEIKEDEPYQVGEFQKDVITTSNLNCRTGRGADYKILTTFPAGTTVNVWYIGKASDGSLWGSCASGVKDSNGKGITGFIHMGYTKVK